MKRAYWPILEEVRVEDGSLVFGGPIRFLGGKSDMFLQDSLLSEFLTLSLNFSEEGVVKFARQFGPLGVDEDHTTLSPRLILPPKRGCFVVMLLEGGILGEELEGGRWEYGGSYRESLESWRELCSVFGEIVKVVRDRGEKEFSIQDIETDIIWRLMGLSNPLPGELIADLPFGMWAIVREGERSAWLYPKLGILSYLAYHLAMGKKWELRTCAECGALFVAEVVPGREKVGKGKKYCSGECGNRARVRRYRRKGGE